MAVFFAACGGSHGPAAPPTAVGILVPAPDAGIPSDGTGEPDALLLASTGSAANAPTSVSVDLKFDCPRCEVVFDEIHIKADGKREELLQSSAVPTGRLAALATLDDRGARTLAVDASGSDERYTIYFNARLCTRHDVQTCRPAPSSVIVWDHKTGQTTTYPDLAAFERAANLETGCAVTKALTTCKPH